MRIAIVNHGLFPFAIGGMERHTAMLARHLAEMGTEVEVIIPNLTPAAADQLASMKLPFRVVQCPWPKSVTWLHSNYLFSRGVREHLLKNYYHAVYCQGFSAWAYLAAPPPKDSAVTLFNPHGLEMFK